MKSFDQSIGRSSLEELVKLLIDKTMEYLELMGQQDADPTKLSDLKMQIENLRAIIAYRRS